MAIEGALIAVNDVFPLFVSPRLYSGASRMNEPTVKRTHIDFRNSSQLRVSLVLEPWADEYVIEPRDRLSVLAEGPEPGCLEVEYLEGRILVHAWGGATIRIFRGTEELGVGNFKRHAAPEDY